MTGVTPAELVGDGMSGAMFNALLRQSEAAEWTSLHELAAVQCELLHGLIRVVVRALGGDAGKPLVITRPGQEPEKPPVVSAGQLARMLKAGG